MWAKSLRENVQAFSTDIELLCHLLIFSPFGEFISLSFQVSFVCVLAVSSGLHITQTPSFWYLFTYVYDTLQIILMIEIISIYL